MEEVPYRLMQLKVAPKTWEMIETHIVRNAYVAEDRKPEWRQAVAFVKQEMGSGFLTTSNQWHPVNHLLGVGGSGQVEEFIKWVETLKDLKQHCKSYSIIRQKLHSSAKCRPEAMPFMDIACCYRAHGFAVEFIKEKQNAKTPDIALTYPATGETIFLEVSRLENSSLRDKQGDQYETLLNVIQFSGYDLPVGGCMKRYMDNKTLLTTLDAIKESKEKCWNTQSMVFIDNDDIAVAFSTNNSFDQLQGWCEKTGYPKGFNGLAVDFKDIPRLTDNNKIGRKAKQIPAEETGLLYFPIQTMFTLVTNPADFILEIGPFLLPLKHILGVVLYSESIGNLRADCYHNYKDFIYSVKTNEAGTTRETIYIENVGYSGTLSDQTKKQIRKSICYKL